MGWDYQDKNIATSLQNIYMYLHMCAHVSDDKILPTKSATSISKEISNLPEKNINTTFLLQSLNDILII